MPNLTRVAVLVASASLIAGPAAIVTAGSASAVTPAGPGTLVVCETGLGEHGRQAGFSTEETIGGGAISAAWSHRRGNSCTIATVDSTTRFTMGRSGLKPYRLKSVKIVRDESGSATYTKRGVRVTVAPGQTVKIVFSFGKIKKH
jgi:hypothetical protein